MKIRFIGFITLACVFFLSAECNPYPELDLHPVSVYVDDVRYESERIPSFGDKNFAISQRESCFYFDLERDLHCGDKCKTLHIHASSEGQLELHKKYPVSLQDTYWKSPEYNHHDKQYAESGWIMLIDTSFNISNHIKVAGKFEIIFEDLGDDEPTRLTEGDFGPMNFNYYYHPYQFDQI